jgi:hypothetical protein
MFRRRLALVMLDSQLSTILLLPVVRHLFELNRKTRRSPARSRKKKNDTLTLQETII